MVSKESMLSQNSIDHPNSVVVDFYLLTPIHYLAEALLHPLHKKALLDLFDFVIKNKSKLGRNGLLYWLENKTDFSQKKLIETILKTTPLGNPAWWLFASSSRTTLELLKDLNSLISNTNAIEPKSLRSLIQKFIQENPKYGSASDVAKSQGRKTKDILAEWESQWTTFKSAKTDENFLLGDLTTKLMLLQRAAAPQRPETKTKNNRSPIYRPEPVLYAIALKDMMTGTAVVAKEVWDEMLSLYHTKSFTSFLAFAPLFLQPFVYSHCDIPLPNLNTLATLLGDFSGKSSSFIGDATKNDKLIRWETLGLTIGKLCIKTEELDPVTLKKKPLATAFTTELSATLDSTTRICGELADMTDTPLMGDDLGWIVISDELMAGRWDLTLTDIKNALITDKISYNKFPTVRKSHVFKISQSLTRLDWWDRKQAKRGFSCQLSSIFEMREQPPSKDGDRAPGKISAYPFLTYTLRAESTDLEQPLKKDLSDFASTAETPAVKMCDRSGCSNSTLSNLTHLKKGVQSSSFASNAEAKTDMCVRSGAVWGINQFFIAESFKEDRYKKDLVSRLRQQKYKILKAEAEKLEANLQIKTMDDETLINTIRDRLEHYRNIEVEGLYGNDKAIRIGELEVAFAELMWRKLGMTFPNLVGLKTYDEVFSPSLNPDDMTPPLRFRYRLGDEEATAVQAWADVVELETENNKSPTPATVAVRRVWSALSIIFVSQHMKKTGVEWSVKNMWNYRDFQRFSILSEDDAAGVLSLVPHLYWTYVMKEADLFRVRTPDMTTFLFLPTARVSYFDFIPEGITDELKLNSMKLELEKKRCERQRQEKLPVREQEPKKEKVKYLPDTLEEVRISSLSLCPLTDWKPESILESAKSYFEVNYSPDLHPEQTQYIRLYVKKGVAKLIDRLDNKNLIQYLTYISKTAKEFGVEKVEEIFKDKKEELKAWYNQFTEEFGKRWGILGDEWVSFTEIEDDFFCPLNTI